MRFESEKKVEKFLKFTIEQAGGMCYKFQSPGRRFVTDRICVLNGGVTVWVECKGETGSLSKGQLREIHRLRALEHEAFAVSSTQEVKQLMEYLEIKYGPTIRKEPKAQASGDDS